MGSYMGPGVAFATNFKVIVMGGMPVIQKGLIQEFELASIIRKICIPLIDPAVFSTSCTFCFFFQPSLCYCFTYLLGNIFCCIYQPLKLFLKLSIGCCFYRVSPSSDQMYE